MNSERGGFGRPNGRGTFGGRAAPNGRSTYVSVRERQLNIAATQQNGENRALLSPTTAVGQLTLGEMTEKPSTNQETETDKRITASDLAAISFPKRPRTENSADAQAVAKKPKRVTKVLFRGQNFTTSADYNNAKVVDQELVRPLKLKLQRFLSHMARYSKSENQESLKEIRNILNDLTVEKRLNLSTLKASGFMDDEGIKQYLDDDDAENRRFPPDVIDDAAALFFRWNRNLLSGDLMHGLDRKKHTDNQGTRHQWKMEPGYPWKRHSSAQGDNGLFVGQWWPSQLAAWRDGAHGSTQQGISWTTEDGAVSVVMSGGYEDEDRGEVLWYCGTRQGNQAKLDELTSSTKMMDLAQTNSTKIRVLRAAAKNSKEDTVWRPKVGIRYDGLYQIDQKQIVEASTNLWKYLLKRCPDQSPIRDRSGPASRPTAQETSAFASIKQDVFIYQ